MTERWLPGWVLAVVLVAGVIPVVAAREQARSGGTAAATAQDRDARQWIQLFNGRDLADWTIKFTKHDLGENFRNTFRVEVLWDSVPLNLRWGPVV